METATAPENPGSQKFPPNGVAGPLADDQVSAMEQSRLRCLSLSTTSQPLFFATANIRTSRRGREYHIALPTIERTSTSEISSNTSPPSEASCNPRFRKHQAYPSSIGTHEREHTSNVSAVTSLAVTTQCHEATDNR